MADTTTVKPDIKPEQHPAITQLEEELRETELKVLTGFTLADAIREGSSVTDKAEGHFVSNHEACALGAAYISAKARGYAK